MPARMAFIFSGRPFSATLAWRWTRLLISQRCLLLGKEERMLRIDAFYPQLCWHC